MGSEVELTDATGKRWAGRIVPPHELSAPRMVQLKLENGYNVGVRIDSGTKVKTIGKVRQKPDVTRKAGGAEGRARLPVKAGRPVAVLTTGGTIASRVDYQTGGVRPVHDEEEILELFPELKHEGPVGIVRVFDKLSEDITPEDWTRLADEIVRAFAKGAAGVVVTHGTDTLHFTASALSFLLENLPGPVVLVGAQRSPDRPSSDGFTNLAAAVRVARTPYIHEVVVVMHAGLSDDRWAIHRSTRVRKMHSSRRDAFESRNGPPLGVVSADNIVISEPLLPETSGPVRVSGSLEPKVGLLWTYPGLPPERAEAFASGLKGVVLAGTGLGHAAHAHLDWIRAAVARGCLVAMTTQCLAGSVDPYVYATGRELLRAGVVYAGDMLPETAYVKLLWSLGGAKTTEEATGRLMTNRAGEFVDRHTVSGGPE